VKTKMCPICLTDDYDLIRNCELRGGRFEECAATTIALIEAHKMLREPKRERAKP
jgi:hypothetical protein